MINDREYRKLKKQITRMQKDAQRAEGKAEQIRKTLEEEFGVSTLKKAQIKLRKLKKIQEEDEKKYKTAVKKFKKKFRRVLKEYEEDD